MRKILGVMILVVGSLLLLAADNGRTTRSAPGVYDANGQFIGTLVDSFGFNNNGGTVVYVPSLQKLVEFDRDGNISSMDLYFTSNDCSGTAYWGPDLMASSTVKEFRSGLYTLRPAGNPMPGLTPAHSTYQSHRCYSSIVADIGGQSPVALVPINGSLPFPVPLAQPLTLK
jgi:hypothetical protein